jgi:hypothetical protein
MAHDRVDLLGSDTVERISPACASQCFRDVLDPGAFDHFEDLRPKVGVFSPAPRQPCLQLALMWPARVRESFFA